MVVAPCPLVPVMFLGTVPLSSFASYRPKTRDSSRVFVRKGLRWAKQFSLIFLHHNLPDESAKIKSLISAKFGQKMTLKSLPIELLEAAETLILYELYIVRFSKSWKSKLVDSSAAASSAFMTNLTEIDLKMRAQTPVAQWNCPKYTFWATAKTKFPLLYHLYNRPNIILIHLTSIFETHITMYKFVRSSRQLVTRNMAVVMET